MKRKSSWQRLGRIRHGTAGFEATPVFVCANMKCELHHRGVKVDGKWRQPDHCLSCKGMVFDRFSSIGEANRWAALRLQEKIGAIKGLRRQVRFPLMTMAPNGLLVKVAEYWADFVYLRDDKEVVEDSKAQNGMDDVAALKLRWMAAQRGEEVLVTTS